VTKHGEINPKLCLEDLALIEDDLRKLIARKIQLYPNVDIQIVGHELTETAEQMHVQVLSMRRDVYP